MKLMVGPRRSPELLLRPLDALYEDWKFFHKDVSKPAIMLRSTVHERFLLYALMRQRLSVFLKEKN